MAGKALPILRLQGDLNHRELATILHALRTIQCEGRIEGCAADACDHFEDTDPLTNEEIDALCERINLGPALDPSDVVLPGELCCPYCRKAAKGNGGIFYERGEFDGKSYEEEGFILTYICECGAELAVVKEGKQ